MEPPITEDDKLTIKLLRDYEYDDGDEAITLREGEVFPAGLGRWEEYGTSVWLWVWHYPCMSDGASCLAFRPEKIEIKLNEQIIDVKPYMKYIKDQYDLTYAQKRFNECCESVVILHEKYGFRYPSRLRLSLEKKDAKDRNQLGTVKN